MKYTNFSAHCFQSGLVDGIKAMIMKNGNKMCRKVRFFHVIKRCINQLQGKGMTIELTRIWEDSWRNCKIQHQENSSK